MNKELGHFVLGKHSTFRNGLNFSKESRGRGCLLVGVPDFQERFSPAFESLSEINPEGIAKADDYLQQGDIVFVRSNGNKALVGRSLYIDKDVEALFSGFCIRARLTSSEINKRFFAYFTKTASFKSQIASSAGTNINNLNQDILSQVKVPAFAKEDQKKIAAVLSALDAKIDCNNRINAELEAMAKTLYDYWFVQFDFPDANGKPYKSSGGKMVYNATLKREIPEGWKVLQLADVISRSGTGLNPRDNFQLGKGNNYYVTIKNVSNGRITLDDKCDKIDDEALAIIDRRSQLQVGDVLFTSIEPVGVTYLIQEKPKNWNINESVFTLRPDYKKATSEFLFCLLSSSEMKVFTKNSSTGSIHKGIRHGVLKTYPLTHGGKNLMDRFSDVVKPMLKQMDVLEKENQQLAQLRDWLLPLLMNGQVTVA